MDWFLDNEENDAFEDGLFEETSGAKSRREKAEEFNKNVHGINRKWGLRYRDQLWDEKSKRSGEIIFEGPAKRPFDPPLVVRFEEKPGQQGRVWDCSLVLAKFISRYYLNDFFSNKSVIELGCGIGVPGITAAVLGASNTVLTDMEMAIPWIDHNIKLNQANISNKISAKTLNWEHSNALDDFYRFDVILLSDLIYGDTETCIALVSMLKKLTRNNSTIVSAHEERFAGDKGRSFFNLLKEEKFHILPVEHAQMDPIYQAPNIFINIIYPPAETP